MPIIMSLFPYMVLEVLQNELQNGLHFDANNYMFLFLGVGGTLKGFHLNANLYIPYLWVLEVLQKDSTSMLVYFSNNMILQIH